ncbi:MAG: YeeE/YedE family protein [Rhizobiales bacterium]|nr:YeeE/YedE family protein [Hyphomicrobiales bacterium]
MQIDWVNFTPLSALLGGALIGLAAALLINVNGRVMGASGILGGLFSANADWPWRLSFLAGLIAPAIAMNAIGAPKPVLLAGTSTLIVAGILVGFGTRLGSGCTSGHGICGIARISPRSIVATLVFMLAGIATVYVVRHALAGAAS